MGFEKFSSTTEASASLADKFKSLREESVLESAQEMPLEELEEALRMGGLTLAEATDVIRVINDNTLLCRSESFTKILDLVSGNDLMIENPDNHANMCVMASGSGFKTAMQEGFSGNDVGGTVKTVLTFRGTNLNTRGAIPKDDELWRTKPTTAQVSLQGKGIVTPDDVVMISFRFPINYVSDQILTEDERELLENDKIQFIVRHYCREEKTATQ